MTYINSLENYLPHFYRLTEQLSKICQEAIDLSANTGKHRLDLFYRFPGGKLFFSIYEAGYSRLGQCNFLNSYQGITVVINYFVLDRKETGLGSCIVETVLNLLQQLDCTLVILKAQNIRAAKFWQKQSFLPLPGTCSETPIMYLVLKCFKSESRLLPIDG